MSTSWSAPVPEQTEQRSGGVSVPHLVMGLVFLGLSGAWLLNQVGVIESVEVQWLLPLVLVVAGAAGLLASLAKRVSRVPRKQGDNATETQSDSASNGPTDETFVTDHDTP